jgi:hypothetical protein
VSGYYSITKESPPSSRAGKRSEVTATNSIFLGGARGRNLLCLVKKNPKKQEVQQLEVEKKDLYKGTCRSLIARSHYQVQDW